MYRESTVDSTQRSKQIKNTNNISVLSGYYIFSWTDTDYSVACKTMGFGGGGFYKWYRRNNDTFPLVLPQPHCRNSDNSLFTCPSWKTNQLMLSENLCRNNVVAVIFIAIT